METTFQNIAEIVEKKIETSNKDIFISDLFTDLGQFSKIDQFREILCGPSRVPSVTVQVRNHKFWLELFIRKP